MTEVLDVSDEEGEPFPQILGGRPILRDGAGQWEQRGSLWTSQ